MHKAGPSRLPPSATAAAANMTFQETVETLASFLEVVIHTILAVRQVYPPSTFTRRRAHGVPVYQSRHPEVRKYVADTVAEIARQIDAGAARRVTVLIRRLDGVPLERFIVDLGYMDMSGLEGGGRGRKIQGSLTPDDLSLRLRAFLIRLAAIDGHLHDFNEPDQRTFAIVMETQDDIEPVAPDTGAPSPWVPALVGDTASTSAAIEGHHEPLLSVRAVETGVIDVSLTTHTSLTPQLRMMVQECVGKTGVQHLHLG